MSSKLLEAKVARQRAELQEFLVQTLPASPPTDPTSRAARALWQQAAIRFKVLQRVCVLPRAASCGLGITVLTLGRVLFRTDAAAHPARHGAQGAKVHEQPVCQE